jgi:hypothetical protein
MLPSLLWTKILLCETTFFINESHVTFGWEKSQNAAELSKNFRALMYFKNRLENCQTLGLRKTGRNLRIYIQVFSTYLSNFHFRKKFVSVYIMM